MRIRNGLRLALCWCVFPVDQDAAPVLGDHIGIFGAGTVGALTAALLAPRFEAANQGRQVSHEKKPRAPSWLGLYIYRMNTVYYPVMRGLF